jgi:acyl-CoA thioester hydrolase
MRDPFDLASGPRSITTARVRYPETDRMGVAHHSHYLVWFELGRTELMREIGCPYGELEDHAGVFFPVISVEARFRSSARYDERMRIETVLAHVGGARVEFLYRICSEEDGRVLTTGSSEHASVGRSGRPCRIPPDVRDRLSGDGARRGALP